MLKNIHIYKYQYNIYYIIFTYINIYKYIHVQKKYAYININTYINIYIIYIKYKSINIYI